MKRNIFLALSLLATSLLTGTAHALYIDSQGHTILDFAEFNNFELVSSYGEVNWSNAIAISLPGYGIDDDNAGINAFSFLGVNMSATSSNGFSLFDGNFKTTRDTTITVTGSDTNGNALSTSFDLFASDGWAYVDFQLFNVDTLSFTSNNSTQFFMDNIDVPEPSALALLAIGLLGLSLARKKA